MSEPNKVWVTDITYIRTHEGWLYLAAVLDLFSRQVVGWSMGARIDRELALQVFLKAHRLKPSMSRLGNCNENALAESFFQKL